MYFSKIQLLPDISGKDLPFGISSVYQQHKLIWRLFCDHDGARDFVYRHDQSASGRPEYYTVSNRPPEDSDGIWNIQTKPYHPVLRAGDLLQFKLRANPTVTRTIENSKKRHDVVMDRKHKLGWKQLDESEVKPSLNELVYETGREWLEKRACTHGFRVLGAHLRVDGYVSHKFYKKSRTPVHISMVDFSGIVEVTIPEKFAEALSCGIGPAKGFGCGLIMVKRP